MNTILLKLFRIAIFLLLLVIAIVAIYPIIYMFLSSMKTSIEFILHPIALPETLYWDNFLALYYRFSIIEIFLNTIICVGAALLLSMVLTIPASYAFAKLNFKFKNPLFLALIATMTIPGITFIIPNYLLFSRVGLIDSFLSVILIWGITSVPGNVFLLTALMRGLPNETIEATKIDGANYYQIMMKMIVPMSLPGIMTISIFNSTAWWNDLLTPLVYLQSDNMKTMTVAVATILGRFSSDYPLLLSGLFIASVPPIAIYIGLQGYIRKGLVIGAVK